MEIGRGVLTENRTILGMVLFGALWFVLPNETVMNVDGDVDWFGAFLGLTSLILFNFVWKYGFQIPFMEAS